MKHALSKKRGEPLQKTFISNKYIQKKKVRLTNRIRSSLVPHCCCILHQAPPSFFGFREALAGEEALERFSGASSGSPAQPPPAQPQYPWMELQL